MKDDSASMLYAAERLGPRIPRQVERPNRGRLYPSGVGAEPRVPADAQDSTENCGAVSSVVDPSQKSTQMPSKEVEKAVDEVEKAARPLIHPKMKCDYAHRLIPNETKQSASMIEPPIHVFFARLPITVPPASVKMTKLGMWLMPTSDCF